MTLEANNKMGSKILLMIVGISVLAVGISVLVMINARIMAEAEARREWRLVFEEDFTDPDVEENWEVIGAKKWEVKDGEFHFSGGTPQILVLKKPVSGSLRFEFDCHQESKYLNDVSCFVGADKIHPAATGEPRGYEFKYGGFNNLKNAIMRDKKIFWQELGSPLIRSKRYHMRIEVMYDHLYMEVNGKKIAKVVDRFPIKGSDRNIVGLYGWRSDTWYDNIKVYTLSPPLKSGILERADQELEKGNLSAARDLFREALNVAVFQERKEEARIKLNNVIKQINKNE